VTGLQANLNAKVSTTTLATSNGAGMVGLSNTGYIFTPNTVQAGFNQVFGAGTVHASAFGLVSNSSLDQANLFIDVIEYCSNNRISLDIAGMDIRLGKQNTTNPKYLYLSMRTNIVNGTFQLGEEV